MGHTFLCVLGLFLLVYFGHARDPVLTIEPNWSTLFTGESVTLICDARETDWYYTILKGGHEFFALNTNMNYALQSLTTWHSGEWSCIARHKLSTHYTKESNKVSLTVSDGDVILEGPASTVYEGESVTLRCRHRTPRREKSASFYKDGSLIEMDTNHQSPVLSRNTVQITIQPLSHESSYKCKFDEHEESQPIKLKVESHRPKAELRKDNIIPPAGGNMTLTCSVNSPSYGWKYFWYRGGKTSEPLTEQDVTFLSNDKISVSKGGFYWCRGGRGDPVYYTEYSDLIVTNRAVVTLQPNWPERYYGEMITLTCEVEDGGDTEWEYEWAFPRSYTTEKHSKYIIRGAQSSHTGDYRCFGRLKYGTSSTQWSDVFSLTLFGRPQPVLTVSPSWLSPGDSVTLNCELQHPSAGWRFYWYKIVPKLSGSYSYSSELLPDSTNGTEQDSYIIHEQTHTAGYKCRAGRGDPVYFTDYSKPKFVWSGDFHSSASLTVNPDRVQHFTSDSVSLTCEGNSTEWRVRRFSKSGPLTYCSSWDTMTGSTCKNRMLPNTDAVYWCEFEKGQFSNAVNITGRYGDMIMVSPVYPVAEGFSVTLSCKLKTGDVPSYVDFYKNDKLIQNDTRKELTISAVSKSDEGFYKCKVKDSQGQLRWISPESWMSVKSVSRPLRQPKSQIPVLGIVGPICGVLLIILLLLFLYRYTKSKGSCFIRSQRTNQRSATDHMINQDKTQGKEYAAPLHEDACLYETIKDQEEAENDESSDVTYSLIELKNIAKKGKHNVPEDGDVYSNYKMETAAGKSSLAAADETIYSELKT